VFSSWNAIRPKHECAYTLTPIFTWHWGDDMSVPTVADAPDSMLTQSDAFRTLLLRDHGVILPDEEIPHVLSLYEGKTLEDLCDVVNLKICGQGKH
jgi:hypothetical protein